MDNMIQMYVSLKLNCDKILSAIHGLLASLISLDKTGKDNYASPPLSGRAWQEVVLNQSAYPCLCVCGCYGCICCFPILYGCSCG